MGGGYVKASTRKMRQTRRRNKLRAAREAKARKGKRTVRGKTPRKVRR